MVKGSSEISFVKPDHTHAYVRIGTETKLMTSYTDLFDRMKSLVSCNLLKKTSNAIDHEVKKASVYKVSDQSYQLFQRVQIETGVKEFKEIFADPKKTIIDEHIKKYSVSFLNSDGGDILFGIAEDQANVGFTVGISLSEADRMELLLKSSKIICNFYPPVDSSQFSMKFIEVKCDLKKNVLQFPEINDEREAFVAVRVKNAVARQLVGIVRSKMSESALLRLPNERFGILVKDSSKSNKENFQKLKGEISKLKDSEIETAKFEEVEASLKDLCIVHLHVKASLCPIHLTSPFHTFCLDHRGIVDEMELDQIIERFAERDYPCDLHKLFNVVNRFEKQKTSYVLICSPFSFPTEERNLYGLVVPEWALVLDFDQNPNKEGHLFNIFKPLHDRYQENRNIFLKTLDQEGDQDPRDGVCWCAVRGCEEISKTLCTRNHASWMDTYRHKMIIIENLITRINSNQLVVVCLWDKNEKDLLPTLEYILQHILSCWRSTKVAFVCSDSSTKRDVLSLLVEPLERAGFEIKRDNIFVALPREMARHVGAKLPSPSHQEKWICSEYSRLC